MKVGLPFIDCGGAAIGSTFCNSVRVGRGAGASIAAILIFFEIRIIVYGAVVGPVQISVAHFVEINFGTQGGFGARTCKIKVSHTDKSTVPVGVVVDGFIVGIDDDSTIFDEHSTCIGFHKLKLVVEPVIGHQLSYFVIGIIGVGVFPISRRIFLDSPAAVCDFVDDECGVLQVARAVETRKFHTINFKA